MTSTLREHPALPARRWPGLLLTGALAVVLAFPVAAKDKAPAKSDKTAAQPRMEKDLLGEKAIPADAYYGVQAMRALENFQISGVLTNHYPGYFEAWAIVKLAAARANTDVGAMPKEKLAMIEKACQAVRDGKYADQFRTDWYQGGAGTSTNMNANEVLANIALELSGHKKGEYQYVEPHDDLNMSQSTNDAYPTAIKIALILRNSKLISELEQLSASFHKKGDAYLEIVKMGRTEMQDAVPMTVGQEFHAFGSSLDGEIQLLRDADKYLYTVNMGATAIGTGLNAPEGNAEKCAAHLAQLTGKPIVPAADMLAATWDQQGFVVYSGALMSVAIKLSKIASDLILLTSGPRAGLAEINLPPLRPGSSIMPGKVNPVMPKLVNLVAFRVMGNDYTVNLAAHSGELQLNAYEPVEGVARSRSPICSIRRIDEPEPGQVQEAAVQRISREREPEPQQGASSMKASFKIHLALVALLAVASWQNAIAQEKKLPNVTILATGGTIAGAAASGTQAGYTSGAVTIDAMLQAVPGIKEVANVKGEQISNVGSQDMSFEIMLKLAKRINEILPTPAVEGIVITHGTDTMEETAYFLNLVVKSNKPVVLVGSMRPSTAISADGPLNLYNAVALAADPQAKGRGVLVLMNDWIHGAHSLAKTSTTAVHTFMSPLRGLVGVATYGNNDFYSSPTWKHTTGSEFDVSGVTAMPRVDIIFACADMSPDLIDAAAANGAKGIVIAGVGNGNMNKASLEAAARAAKKGVIVVRSSRVATGSVGRNVEVSDDELNLIASDELNPQKSRILLSLALLKPHTQQQIQQLFYEY